MMFSVTATYKVHVKGWKVKVTSPMSALGTRLQLHANCLNAVLENQEKIPHLPSPLKPTETGHGLRKINLPPAKVVIVLPAHL